MCNWAAASSGNPLPTSLASTSATSSATSHRKRWVPSVSRPGSPLVPKMDSLLIDMDDRSSILQDIADPHHPAIEQGGRPR